MNTELDLVRDLPIANGNTVSIIAHGPFSLVACAQTQSTHPAHPRCLAIKTSTTAKAAAKEPHDIVKEARLLASAAHPNIVAVLGQKLDPGGQSLSFWMPYVPYTLSALLSSNTFSPHPLISLLPPPTPSPRERTFALLAKSLIFQTLAAVAYLHDTAHIAHRDIKPANVLLTATGRVQLIDFGISWKGDEPPEARERDLWPEPPERMYFEVSTGPYRAPELLFGPRTYDAFAIDLWSLGATFAEFFTPLRLSNDDDDGIEEDDEDEDDAPPAPFIIPRALRPSDPSAHWARAPLFDAHRGEIGLAWSIFKTRGSPTEDTWPYESPWLSPGVLFPSVLASHFPPVSHPISFFPSPIFTPPKPNPSSQALITTIIATQSFLTLPDATKVSFIDAPGIDLRRLLPNLPPSSLIAPALPSSLTAPALPSALPTTPPTHPTSAPTLDTNTTPDTPTPLDLIDRLLAYEPTRRLRAASALRHAWFAAAPGVLLPVDYPPDALPPLDLDAQGHPPRDAPAPPTITHWEDKSLGDLLRAHLPSRLHDDE
ncbi:kinase-like protein [Leucogyrophana mollusca]|uniref:Kinase-like protein n=1 Tax=Leucogyrophana mollusca TaxID=85980 RepID=A0ACB8BMH1_9AGAM|nr:kinase-like protein [Leucogyrophana mollusca]